VGFGLSSIKRFFLGAPARIANTAAVGRSAVKEIVAGAVSRDRFDEGLASGKLADPAPMKEFGWAIRNRPAHGRLFVDGISEADISQRGAGDCYFLAALAAVARTQPELLKNAIAQNPDGTVTVTFHSGGQRVPITVDADLPRLRLPLLDAANVYGGSTTPGELWPALVEKAYAQWKGGYDAIGNGGYPAEALVALTGKAAASLMLRGLEPTAIAARLEELSKGGAAITATTPENVQATGIVSHHVYTVDGAQLHEGEWWVKLRNPWARGEPAGFGVNDGEFMMPAKDFVNTFSSVSWIG
jgi:hypothetical protein